MNRKSDGGGSDITDEVSGVSQGSKTSAGTKSHPSRSLGSRSKGYGIGGGYERPYRKPKTGKEDNRKGQYGPLPHAGYYGAGSANRPFKAGEASFSIEVEWYRNQYGERTSGYEEAK